MNFGITCSPVLWDQQRALAAHSQCEIPTETRPKFFPAASTRSPTSSSPASCFYAFAVQTTHPSGCTEMTLVAQKRTFLHSNALFAQKRTLLHRNVACCTAMPLFAQ